MKRKGKYFMFSLILIISACGKGNKNDTPNGSSAKEIEEASFNYDHSKAADLINQWLDSTEVSLELPEINFEPFATDVFLFYSKRNFQPAWKFDEARELVILLYNINKEGLNPASFPLEKLDYLMLQSVEDTDAKTGARMDILLSVCYLKIADMIATGKVKPGKLSSSWHIKPKSPDTLYVHLQQAVDGDVNASLDYFRPDLAQYARLQVYLERYLNMVEEGGWPEVPFGEKFDPGDSSENIVIIRERLFITGDYKNPPTAVPEPAIYDEELRSAVNKFQKRHGMQMESTIDDDLIAIMNVPAEMRLKQIMLNLDRIRWFSSGDMPETYVLVNIPEYTLRVFEEDKPVKRMKVVVGEVMNTTPVFSDMIEYAVFSPYWNVPNSIATNEIWPAARNNPAYLRNNNYEVLRGWDKNADIVDYYEIDWESLNKYRIRQKPGPWNALGRVKFMFPNDFAIYLHDTPADQLFDKQHRAFSHGCIRVEEPEWFADWLFPQYNRHEVLNKMNNSSRDVVAVESPVPVFIIYLTAFVDEEGQINFRKDLYKLDERLTDEFNAL